VRTYCLKCPCGWTGEMMATAAKRDVLRCPQCKADTRLETDFEAQMAPASTIEYNFGKGAELVSEGCLPKEVAGYRRNCPNLTVREDGTFITRNKSHTKQILREIAVYRDQQRRALSGP